MVQLTAEQIAQFHQDGFLVIEDLLSPAWVERVVQRVEPLFAGEFETGVYPDEWHWNPYLGLPGASGQMSNVWKCDRTIASVVLSAEMGRICSTLAGWSGARILLDSLWRKPCGANETTLHQDSMYTFYHTPQEIVTGWIALSDAVQGAGTIEYVRGSHKWALSQTVSEFHATGKHYRWDMEQAAKQAGIDEPEVVQLELKPGSCAFHHGHMWHGSGKNLLPGKIRRSLVLALAPAEARFQPSGSYVPGGYVPGRYKRYGDDTMDESFFPILWTEKDDAPQDGKAGRTAFLADYCDDALAPSPAMVTCR